MTSGAKTVPHVIGQGNKMANARPMWRDPDRLSPSIRGPARAGSITVGAFGLVFGFWGLFVPIAGGAVAPGVINTDGSKRTIQHFEGGIISELRVRDGDLVQAGQPLVVLENVQDIAAHDALRLQRWSLLARQARLDTESVGRDEIVWPTELQRSSPAIRDALETQRKIFETRRAAHALKNGVLRQQIEQLSEQIKGLQAQADSALQQSNYIEEEIKDQRALLDKNLGLKPRLLDRQRTQAELSGRRSEYLAQIARARQQIGEAEMQILAAEADRADQIANEADRVRADLADVTEKLRAREDILKRTAVTAPVNGTVINLRFKTIGGVVQKGEPILEIVPSQEALVIDAHVTPTDVKAIFKGLEAQIHLTAYSSRTTPRIRGTVQSVSADRLVDPDTHQPYFLARVEVDREFLQRFAPNVSLVPGMPAEILIVVDHRTMFEYLFKPFGDALRRSFREI